METPVSTDDENEMIQAESTAEVTLDETKHVAPTSLYGRADIAAMLNADAVCRKQQSWPLVSSAEILALRERLDRSPSGISFNPNELLIVEDKPLRQLRDPGPPFREKFIFVQPILDAFPGKLIVAGGSVFKAFLDTKLSVRRRLFEGDDENYYNTRELLNACDVDFFFIDCTKEEVNQIIRFAWDLVNDQKRVAKLRDNDDQIFACADRCQNTTTIYYTPEPTNPEDLNYLAEYDWEDEGGKMQFIHRIYPTKDSVIGGFDLGPSMCFYDGFDFFATPLGAWSIATQAIILDVSRRSTSFEYRIRKYLCRSNCRLVIVNGSSAEVYKMLADDPNLAKKPVRCIFPVTGLKLVTRHYAPALYEGLDERMAERKEAEEGVNDDEENDGDETAAVPTTTPGLLQALMAGGFGARDDQEDEEGNEDDGSLDEDADEAANGNVVPAQLQMLFALRNEGSQDERTPEEEAELRDAALYYSRQRYMGDMKKNLNRFTTNFDERNQISDYDGGHFNSFTFAEANAVFAAKGKADCIVWRSNTTKGIFEEPDIQCQPMHWMSQAVEHGEAPEECHQTSLYRWFPADAVARMVTGRCERGYIRTVDKDIFIQESKRVHEMIITFVELAKFRASQGITIITENPGRQWTASNNPIVSNVRDYYHPSLLVNGPLLIGIPPNVFRLLYWAWKRSESGCGATWGRLPRDVFRLIMDHLRVTLSMDGHKLLLGYRL